MVRENLLAALDRFKTVVYLKDMSGHYLSMNASGLNFMGMSRDYIIGKTAHDLFDLKSANEMVESDIDLIQSRQLRISSFNSSDRVSGQPIFIHTAKTVFLTPMGVPQGIVGISMVNCQKVDLLSDVCQMLPQFVKKRQHQLVSELLELKTIAQFSNGHQFQ